MQLLPPHEYQPSMASRFVRMQDRIRRLVPESQIEHIGSSSIPGSLSKGDLDICVVVPPSDHDATVKRLTDYGYAEKMDTLRTEHLCMLEWHQPGDEHAVQLVAKGSAFEFFMTFRDALLSDPSLVTRYNQIKMDASGKSESEYRAAKSRFIEQVLNGFCDCASLRAE